MLKRGRHKSLFKFGKNYPFILLMILIVKVSSLIPSYPYQTLVSKLYVGELFELMFNVRERQ